MRLSSTLLPRSERWLRAYCIFAAGTMLVLSAWGGRLHRHYPIFIEATRDYLHAVNPYHHAYDGSGVGSYWHYSPSAAAVFAPFTLLPYGWGFFLYMGLSLAVLFTGFARLAQALRHQAAAWSGALFYLIVSNDVVGAVFGAKIELLTTGLLCHAFALLLRGKRTALAGALVAFAFSLKLQPIPVVGLLLWALVLARKWTNLRTLLAAGAVTLTVAWGWPWAAMPAPFVRETYATWISTLGSVAQESWGNYQALYQSLRDWLGWPREYDQVRVIAVVGALAYAAWLAGVARRFARSWPKLLWGALGMGASYMVLFSPMGQGMAFVLGAPLVALVCFRAGRRGSVLPQPAWITALLAHWYVSSLSYSDLVPAHLQIPGARPMGFALLTALFAWDYLADN